MNETTTEPTMYQHFRAKNDVNGNPRRCFVVYGADANILDVIDEGYAGRPMWLRDLPQLPTVEVSASYYRELLKNSATR